MTKDVNKSLNQLGKTSTATNRIVADANKVTASVGRSAGALAKTNVAVKQSASIVDNFSKSLSRGLSSINRWGSSFDFTNNSLRKFGTNIANVGKSITRFSFQLERVGRGMMMAFTLPAIAAGYAIVKTAMDFETALVKVENLVGVSRDVVAGWGEEILEFSTRLAVMPVEAANGLFAAASGFGEIAAQAPVMEVLENAIMAMNVGLGETEDIARASTAMLNAFKNTGLDAAQATSLLVLAVREGNLEVEKLAPALGNVLGVASYIGAGADDVLAFISAYTRFGVEPTRAVTALNTALTNLIKPSTTNRVILESYGMTMEYIREVIDGPAGLANLFLMMEQNMSEIDFTSVFGIRSFKGVSAITNSVNEFNEEYMRVAVNMQEETGRTFMFMAKMAEEGSRQQTMYIEASARAGETSMNSLEESIIRTMETLEWKFKQIKSLFSQIFIGIDSAIAPFLKDFADKIIEALESVKKFVETNTESVKLILKVVAALAAAGPALLIFAKVFQAFGVILTVVGGVISLFGTLIGLVVNLAVGMGVLAINVGVRAVQGFLFLGKAIWNVVAAVVALIVKYTVLAVYQTGLSILGMVGAFTSLGGAVATATISVVGFLLAAAPVVAVVAAIVAAIGAIGAVILIATGALVSLGESIASAWQGVLDFFAPVKQEFENLAPEGESWGRGLIASFSKGIYDGLIYLVDALNAVGSLIAYWLKGMSPPRIAPDIDIWGMKTMQEWIDGWKKADFGVFNDIQGTISSFLKSIYKSMGKEDSDGAIAGIILGSREAIANAIDQIKRFGKATKEAMDEIYIAIGTTTLELENYIEATLAAAATTDILGKAQQKVNDINERYSRLLSPIQDQLKAIDRERSKISSTREVDELNKVLARGNLPDQVAALARLRIKEIGLQQDESGLESARDAELSVAELQLQSAEDANEIAQSNLEFAQEALGLQTKGLDTFTEMLKKLDDIKESIGSLPSAIGDAVAEAIEMEPLDFGDLTGGLDFDGTGDGDGEGEGGPLSQLDAKLQELTDKLNETKIIWGEVWTEMTGNVVEW
jgi:TP901 family phage tail tape measure protein